MKTLKLSAGGGSALSGKKLILCIAIAIVTFPFGHGTQDALAEELNYALDGTPTFNKILWNGLDGGWHGVSSYINDDSESDYVGGHACQAWGAGEVHFEGIIDFPEPIPRVARVEYVSRLHDDGCCGVHGIQSGYERVYLYYNDQWHKIREYSPTCPSHPKETYSINGSWSNVSSVKVDMDIISTCYHGTGAGARLYEIRVFSPVYTISGHVWDRNNDPVVGAIITIDSLELGAPIVLPPTDVNGYYETEPLPPRTYTVTGSHTSYSFVHQEVTLDQDLDVSFYTITGYVKRYGVTGPEAGINSVDVIISGGDYSPGFTVTVQTHDRDDDPASPGYYEKQGAGNGTYTIEAQNP